MDEFDQSAVAEFTPTGELAVLKSGKLWMKANVEHKNEEGKADSQALEFAVGDGSDFYMAANSGELELAFMSVDGEVFAVCRNNMTYHRINGLEKMMLKMSGMDIDSMVGEVNGLRKDMGGDSVYIGSETETDDEGRELFVAVYADDAGRKLRYYLDGDKLVKSVSIGPDGLISTISHYDFVRSDVESVIHDPGDNGDLTEVGGMNFIKDLAGFMGESL